MAGMKLSELEFLRLLPSFMRDDEAVIALSKAMNDLLGTPSARIQTIRVWDMIDELNEAECDDLAWELDIDWYDSTGMTLEEKRQTIKLAQQIKRKRGTKWAVESLITAYFGEGYVLEWTDIDTAPYTFAALTTNAEITAENLEKFITAAEAAKNVRSHIVGVFYYWKQGPGTNEDGEEGNGGIEFAEATELHRYNFRKCGTVPRRATLGILISTGIETEPDLAGYVYPFQDCGSGTCGTYPNTGTLGAVVKPGIDVEAGTAGYLYGFKSCGTYPGSGTLGAAMTAAAEAATEMTAALYSFVPCGTRRCGQT